MNLWAQIAASADANPDGSAIVAASVRLTYRELCRRVERYSLPATSRSGEVIALLAADPVEQLIGMLAVLRRGAGYWVVPETMSSEVISERCGQLDCPLVLSGDNEEAKSAFLKHGVDVFLSQGNEERGADETLCDGDCERIGAIYLTSGSMGAPKVIRRTCEQIQQRVALYREECGYSSSDRLSLLTHPGFVAAEGDIYGALLSGASLYLINPKEMTLPQFSSYVREHSISVIHPPVPFFEHWRRSWTDSEECFENLRCIILGGGGLAQRSLEGIWSHLAPGAIVHHRYSSTEAGPVASAIVREDTPVFDSKQVPVGKPYPFVDWKIGDVGETEGELLLKSSSVSPSAPRDRDGYFRTGDWFSVKNEQLLFIGRLDGIVKVRGYRVHLEKVTVCLQRVSGVFGARAVAWNRKGAPQQIVGFVQADDTDFSKDSILDELRGTLSDWEIPAQILVIPNIPITSTGKHDIVALQERLVDADVRNVESNLAADGQTEEKLESLWRAESGWIGDLDSDVELWNHGGDSLTVVAFLARVQKAMGVELTQTDLTKHGTLTLLAVRVDRLLLEGHQNATVTRIAPLNREGFPAIVCFPYGADPAVRHFEFARQLEGQYTVFMVYPRGLDGQSCLLETIEEQADDYSEVVREKLGNARVILCGFSLGGVVAFATASCGKLNVDHVVLLDTQLIPRRVLRSAVRQNVFVRMRDKGQRCGWSPIRICRRAWEKGGSVLAGGLHTARVRWECARARRLGKPLPIAYRDRYLRDLNLKARSQFQLQDYSGEVHFIASNGHDGEGPDARVETWRKWCSKDRLTISHVDATHVGILLKPHVSKTVRLLVEHARLLKHRIEK